MKRYLKFIVFCIVFYIFLFLNNEWITISNYAYESEKVPKAFDGFKITQISDMHDSEFGNNHERLLRKVQETEPDVIFITGDLIDSRRYDLPQSLRAVEQLTKIAPVYYVLGNHEVATNEMNMIYDALENIGVHNLKNESTIIDKDGQSIVIAGIEDPLMGKSVEEMLDIATKNVSNDQMALVLSHRPEQFNTYVEHGIDLVFTGHAHGGQIRLPFLGGLVAPSQGWLPTYTDGVFYEEGTSMVISRGLGNSLFPFRIFNRPEIVQVQLKSK